MIGSRKRFTVKRYRGGWNIWDSEEDQWLGGDLEPFITFRWAYRTCRKINAVMEMRTWRPACVELLRDRYRVAKVRRNDHIEHCDTCSNYPFEIYPTEEKLDGQITETLDAWQSALDEWGQDDRRARS